ncbi:MAG: HIT domain-containing protein [candidate division WOR-3 bacterium]
MAKNCILCQVVNAKLPSYKVYEDKKILGILDINPITKGHCLIIPKKHRVWFTDLTSDEAEQFFQAVWLVAKKLKKAFQAQYVTLLIRGTRIPHLHAHLVPSIKGELSATDRILDLLQYVQENQKPVVKPSEFERIAKKIQKANP